MRVVHILKEHRSNINARYKLLITSHVVCFRNARLLEMGYKPPKATKTGTTIVGIVFKDGVILGADTRATEDTTVADKNCSKIHYLMNNI